VEVFLGTGILASFASFLPWELGVKADAFAPAPAGIRPEWDFMFHTLKLLPAKTGPIAGDLVGAIGFGMAGLIMTRMGLSTKTT
jgi:quinol-cytochrome oxidoreductase complex cytochrome b subunit